jgi:hypothetical protein
MSSPGIDKWIAKAPESWAKLAKNGSKKSFELWKKEFAKGATEANKDYLNKQLTDAQLRDIYERGAGGTITKGGGSPIKPVKPTVIKVERKGKTYTRNTAPRWGLQSKYVLQLASKEKPRSKEYYKYLDILIGQGRTRQASIKKIQRTRSEAHGKK